jgi:hypothetical protein
MNNNEFIYENTITHFRCPIHLVSDQCIHFINKAILTQEIFITHHKSTFYYTQGEVKPSPQIRL